MAVSAVSMVYVPLLITFFSFCLKTTYGDDSTWQRVTATGFDGNGASGSLSSGIDACGYAGLYGKIYGSKRAAVSMPLFDEGGSCGACYELKCLDAGPQGCVAGASVIVTVTNFCPPNSDGGWCMAPSRHFDLTRFAYKQIIQNTDENVPSSFGPATISFRSATCTRSGGIRFTINGMPFLNFVLITNVGGEGAVQAVKIKSSNAATWQSMSRRNGQNWLSNSNLRGQSLSFRVTTIDGKTVTSNNVVPANWQYGQTFEGAQF